MHRQLSIRESVEFSLFHVEKARYESLHLDIVKPYWTVSFVLDGTVETRSPGFDDVALSGDVMIHPPNLPFTETAAGPGVHLWMLVDVKLLPGLHFFQRHPVSRVVRLTDRDAYAAAFESLLDAWDGPHTPLREYRAMSIAIGLLGDILESWMASGSPSRPAFGRRAEDRFLPVVRYMEENLNRKLTREDLARRLHLHPSYFNRQFKTVYGMSPAQMLRGLRLRKAMRMLEDPASTLEGIASACGYGDAAYLSKAFKESMGMTPGDYRRGLFRTKESFASRHPGPSSDENDS
ncbi:AraC family transcriptional regulator [Cohnella nanjingensis]|uniref:Helix-turn-helix transcriptional regulator n=1 Tax=Cohnella nanjingensis TaxID=1387779 RepID=A0A7X0RNT8_9BACL|nr:AraC family transcriptional regulator [Cohnella nanjingensis]MBB6670693.1 helix-turn-helix transcriptional regulator [Cohnella nanjingensis]